MEILKNMDDFLLFGSSMEELEVQIEKLMHWCRQINLKLSPHKFKLDTQVKFSGSVITAEKVRNETLIFIDPPDLRIQALADMPRPNTKKELQTLCGCIYSLQK